MTPRWKKSPRSLVLDLAEHVDGGDRELALARLRLGADLGDHADHDRVAGADAEKLADGRAHVLRADREAHLRLAAADREHAPERAALRNVIHARLPERFSSRCFAVCGSSSTSEVTLAANQRVNPAARSFAKLRSGAPKWPLRARVVKELQQSAGFRRKD